MEDSQLDRSIKLLKKKLESQKNEHSDKETLRQLEELQRKGNGLGIKFPYLKEMIETLQVEIKPPPSQSLAASISTSEEALYGCLRNIMVLVAKKATNYCIGFTSFINLVRDYLLLRTVQMDRYQNLLLSHHVGLLYGKENVLNKRQTLQDERLNGLIEKYYPLRVLIGEKNSEKPSTEAVNSNLEVQDTENEEVGDEISDKTQHSENEGEGEENATSLRIENEEEEDNEDVGGKISNKTQHSENEGEEEENATSLTHGIENEEDEDNEEVGDKISNKTQHSENEGEGEENSTSSGMENEEEGDNEEVGGEISNTTQRSENEEEGEENATSLKKELGLEKATQNDADDEDKIAIWEKERILQLKRMFLNLAKMCDDLSLQLASKKQEIKSYQTVHIPPPESIAKWVRMIMDLVFDERVVGLDDEGFGLIKNMFHAFLKAATEKVVEFYAFQLSTIDNLLGEMSNLVNEKTNVLNERDSFIDEVYDFINEKEKLENEKYDCSKLLTSESSPDNKTKKRSYGDITTSCNDSPERRTRSHLLVEEEEEIPNAAGNMENEEGKMGKEGKTQRMMMMEDSQLDKSNELQRKELESQKNWNPQKETLLQLEELQRKGNGLGIKFPYLKEMIEILQVEIKPPPSQSLAVSNIDSEEALYGCLRNIMVQVPKRTTHYHNGFTSCMNLVYDYLESRIVQMDRYQDSLLSHHVGLLYEKENVLNKRQTLQDERLNELIEKYYPLRVLTGEKKSEKPSSAAANCNLEIQNIENEEPGDEISDKTQHSENEGEGEENGTSLGMENEEEEDNEEVGGEISNTTQHSENEEEGEENAISLKKELVLEKAPQNDADDGDNIAIWGKKRILQLKKTFLNLVRMCDDLSLQLASKKEEIKSYQALHIPPPGSIEKGVRMIMDLVVDEGVVGLDDEGFGLIKNMFHAFLKAATKNVVEFYAFQLNTIDNLLNEMSDLVNEKTNVLDERDIFIDEVYDFINEKENVENEKYNCSKLLIPESSPDRKTKKRSFGDITTSGNDSPERRTRSHLLVEEQEEIPNTAGHMENKEGGENATY